jgi:hypothetical protein
MEHVEIRVHLDLVELSANLLDQICFAGVFFVDDPAYVPAKSLLEASELSIRVNKLLEMHLLEVNLDLSTPIRLCVSPSWFGKLVKEARKKP